MSILYSRTVEERVAERAIRDNHKRMAKTADVQRGTCGDMKAEYGQPGYCFSMRQTSKKSGGGFTNNAIRRYWVFFKLDENLKPVWTGGVKPTVGTMERVYAINWSSKS